MSTEHAYRNSPVPLGYLDRELRFVHCNERLAALLGPAAAELRGRLLARAAPALAAAWDEPLRAVLDSATAARDGVPPPGAEGSRTHFTPVLDDEGTVQGVSLVILQTPRSGMEAPDPEDRAGLFDSLLESMQSGVLIETEDGRILALNRTLCDLLALPTLPESLAGRRWIDVIRDGEGIFEAPGAFRRRTREIVESLKPVRDEEVRLADGRTLGRDYAPVFGRGRLLGHAWHYRDITARKTAESALLEIEDQLRQSQKLEAIGRLAGGVAHDFNNLLMVIIGYAELMLEELGDSLTLRTEAEQIWKTAERASALTRHLLAFGRKQNLQPTILAPNALIREMDSMLGRLIREDVGIAYVLDPAVGHIEADRGQIEQLLVNLVLNARDAMPRGGKIVIETADVELDEAYVCRHVGVEPGSYVRLTVSDTGVGMDKSISGNIFEPFFTTKAKDEGTGLGLSTVYGIVKQSRGNIWVYSEPELGTTFKVYLPRAEPLIETRPRPTVEVANVTGTETLLLVEDEDAVRFLVRDGLREGGYDVLEAKRPHEALRLCRRHAGPIHLLLTDVVMPEMSGGELARRVSALRSETKTLYMSGYTAEAVATHGVLEPGIDFVEKPISPRRVALKVRQILGEQRGQV